MTESDARAIVDAWLASKAWPPITDENWIQNSRDPLWRHLHGIDGSVFHYIGGGVIVATPPDEDAPKVGDALVFDGDEDSAPYTLTLAEDNGDGTWTANETDSTPGYTTRIVRPDQIDKARRGDDAWRYVRANV